jgi:uncharacterized protein (TIGR02996 family)
MLVFEVHQPGAPPRRVELERGDLTIGRSPECGLHIKEVTLSQVHARLAIEDDGPTIVDLISGSYLNGCPIRRPEILHRGDQVILGACRLEVLEAPARRPELVASPRWHELWKSARQARDDIEALLVIADALQEAGDPRGALVALSCRLERIEPGTRAARLREEIDRLMVDHGRRLAAGLPSGSYLLERGLVRSVECDAGTWLASHEAMRRVADIRRLTLHTLDERLQARLVRRGDFTGVEVLSLSFGIARRDLRALAKNRTAADLRALSLGGQWLDDAAALDLAGSRHLTGLRELSFSSAGFSPEGVVALFSSPGLESCDFNFWGTRFGDDELEALLASGRFPRHGRCDLRGFQRMTERGLRALLESGRCADLKTLRLSWQRIGDDGARRLAACEALSGLEELDVTDGLRSHVDAEACVGAAGLEALCRASHLHKLRRVALGDCYLCEGTAHLPWQASWLHQLEELEVRLEIDGQAFGAALREGRLSRLRRLVLTAAVDAVAALLLEAAPPDLRLLELHKTPDPPGSRLSAATRERLRESFGTIVELDAPWNRWSPRLRVQ